MNAAALVREAHAAGVSIRLVGGGLKAAGKLDAVQTWAPLLRQHKAEILELLRLAAIEPEPAENPNAWRELAQAYHAHHWQCPTCKAGGQGRGLRCGVGAALWGAYQNSDGAAP